MRARNIKPQLFKNEVLGVADPLLTILFEGLWCEADRDGRLEDRPLRLKAEIFPYRDNANVDAMLNWLMEQGFITRYEVRGIKVIQVSKFSDHQRPHANEVESVLPPMEASKHNQGKKRLQPRRKALRSDPLFSDSGSLIPDSGSLIPEKISDPPDPHSDAKPSEEVRQVFDHWRGVWNHPSAALDAKRTATIRRALKGYSVADLCESISGYRNSGHHSGLNDRNTVYDGLHLLLRDADHIDAGLRFAREPPEISSKLQQHNVTALQAWRPQELRDDDQRLSEISGSNGEIEHRIRKGALPGPH